ncbi:MAG: PqqD family protein [Eubacterium sp.]|nr:PqqD family protein [Eubacterium sp.]
MKIKKGFMKREISGKHLVVTTGELSRENSMFIELNDTSSYIWDLIERGVERKDIPMRLCKRYSVSLEKASADTEKLIKAMEEAGIFEEE